MPVERLLTNGILTLDSSTNRNNVVLGFSQITIDFDSLPPRSKNIIGEIRDYLSKVGVPKVIDHKRGFQGTELYVGKLDDRIDRELVELFIPTNDATTFGHIEDEAMKFVDVIV